MPFDDSFLYFWIWNPYSGAKAKKAKKLTKKDRINQNINKENKDQNQRKQEREPYADLVDSWHRKSFVVFTFLLVALEVPCHYLHGKGRK